MKKEFNKETASMYAQEVARKPLQAELSPELMAIAEKQAKASHEGWIKGKMAKGYVYGPVTNDDPEKGQLTNPLLVPYEDLPEDVKESNRANAVAILKILQVKGCQFVSFTEAILYPIAKHIHDEWCREKLASGWVWGEVTDKANKVHRDLVPFEVLASTPELVDDIAYDVDTARQIIIKMMTDCDTYVVISNIAAFQSQAI